MSAALISMLIYIFFVIGSLANRLILGQTTSDFRLPTSDFRLPTFYYLSPMDLLLPLHLPPYPFKITEHKGQLTLFDEIRKKNIIITPEEWVRQHFVQYLINQKQFPKSLIKLEGGHKLHGMPKRSDIIVYNPAGEKILLVECKAPSVNINQSTFDQIARYNMVHKTKLLAVSNGLQHYYCRIDFETRAYNFVEELPGYFEL